MLVRPRLRMLRGLTGVLTAVATAAAAAVLAGAGPAAAARDTSCVPPPVAHRGDSARAPENTMPAFRKALRLGVDRLELDVRFSAEGTPVVMHDPTVDRKTNGSGEVAVLTLPELKALDAGSWFSSQYAGTKVPTLYQVLAMGGPRGATFLVDLKVRPTPEQMERFLNRFRWLGLLDRVRVLSFDGQTVLDVRAAEPSIRTGIIANPTYRQPDSVLQYGTTYAIHQFSVTGARASQWHAAGIEVRPWTVDRVRVWRRMARDDIGAIITSRPRRYVSWARATCS